MDNTTVLEMQGMCKAFDGHPALDHVNFQLNGGEIHGLLGGNGAGKTTLMNVLYGLYRADAGEIILRGRKVEIRSPKDAIGHNIGMVHQHFLQIESFTVAENVVPGTPIKNALGLDLKAAAGRIATLGEKFGLGIDPAARIEDLSMGARQRVEILKALYRGAQILILDEPTTNLTPQEVDTLFHTVQAMVREGMSVVFITHKLREVLAVCERISVLRDGRNVLTLRRGEATEDEFVRGMVGEQLDIRKSIIFSGRATANAAQSPHPGRGLPDQPPVLQVEGLGITEAGVPLVKGASFQVRAGEIFGIAGVAGNGQLPLAEAVMGVRAIAQGRATVLGTDVAQIGTAGLLAMGVAYVPEDRLHDGFLPSANVAQNLILGSHRGAPYARGGFLDWKTIFRDSRDLITQYNIRTSGPDDVGGNLSGGNIQRVLIARAFAQPSTLLIAHNPTRGLDIPSTEFVYGKLLERKTQGGATLLLSEDLDELLLLSDRIGVIYKGEIVGVLERGAFDKYAIGRMMSGVRA
ncbi:MAG: ABC transporter ATP-binding protein [Chloroflexi bacterium]|nr:ABC transporter ATP-binding protein [Chloroflexota bacterium]